MAGAFFAGAFFAGAFLAGAVVAPASPVAGREAASAPDSSCVAARVEARSRPVTAVALDPDFADSLDAWRAALRCSLRSCANSPADLRAAVGVPLFSRSSAATTNSARASSTAFANGQGSGTRSRHPMNPKCRLPSSDITVQLRPAPWKTGPRGSIFSIFAPRKYSGKLGPGTFEMTRLCTTGWRSDSRSREYMRTAEPNTEGAANCAQSVSRLASSASVWSLATVLASRIASSRPTGSSMSVARDMNMPETRLVPGRDSAACTDMGTMAMSGLRGSASRSSRYLRRAVEQTASTTSLTVVPNAFLTRLMSARSTLA